MREDDQIVTADEPDRRGDEQTVFVRAKGYAEESPVVRRIRDRDLYLGNALAADPGRHGETFEYVLSACMEARPLTTHHCPLDDGPGNPWSAFESAVDTSRQLHRRDGSLLVHCKLGISRSSALLATEIAAEEDRSFHDALALVQDARPHAVPNPALHELAVIYLAARARDGD